MRTLTFLLWSVVLGAQTKLPVLQGGAPTDLSSPWCPGPVFTVAGERSLIIGANWSVATPCMARFLITPPTRIDPVAIAKFTSPVIVTLSPAATSDDDLYFWISSPAAGVAKVQVGQRYAGTLASCSGCEIITQTTTPRTFPPMTMPIGMIPVVSGKLFRHGYDMISYQPVNLAQGVVAVVQRDQDGYSVRLESTGQATPTAATVTAASLQALQAETVRNRAALANLEVIAKENRPDRLTQLEQQIKTLSNTISQLRQDIPIAPASVAELKQQIENAQEILSRASSFADHQDMLAMRLNETLESTSVRMQDLAAQQIEYQMTSRRVAPPTLQEYVKGECAPLQYAVDSKFRYDCTDEHKWIRTAVVPLTKDEQKALNTPPVKGKK